ncbi:hypothetical protein DPEC_G00350720 [Dallia pectoralis]|uniref:Uncharacterized protein n=1 Tax=Dallia pectoralis TaxID=75939 RepID=A0ACC2F1U4_DALPE|nr:hypothetical protein DPEC_G00350720 [Dallia pectoralis]
MVTRIDALSVRIRFLPTKKLTKRECSFSGPASNASPFDEDGRGSACNGAYPTARPSTETSRPVSGSLDRPHCNHLVEASGHLLSEPTSWRHGPLHSPLPSCGDTLASHLLLCDGSSRCCFPGLSDVATRSPCQRSSRCLKTRT